MAEVVTSNGIPAGSVPAKTPAQLRWQRSPGVDLAVVERPSVRDLHLTLIPQPGDSVGDLIERLGDVLKRSRAMVVQQFVFGSAGAHAEMLHTMRASLHAVDWPVIWVEGASCGGNRIAGIQVHAVAGVPVHPLFHNGRVVGRVFDDGVVRHCLLGDLGPAHATVAAPEQARETFENLGAALELAGMSLKDVARTWLFLDDMLSWYTPFNAVRNAFFARNEMRPETFPASTGVGGRNPRGEAITAAAWAVQSHGGPTCVRVVPSPKQCPAPAYGSAFSRAVEIVSPHQRCLLVSGTASVAPDGRTAHVGDARSQIQLTMEVVGAILSSRGLAFGDVTRATAYFKSAADFPLFNSWCLGNGLEALPAVSACCQVCRDDLLFEIELDAVSCGG